MALASQIKRWLLAGALMLSGLFSLLAAHAFHGHARTATVHATHRSDDGGGGGVQQPAPGGLQQPASAPAPAPTPAAPAPVVSGGS